MRWSLLALLLPAGSLLAQHPVQLDPVVVTAERISSTLSSSMAAVTRLTAAELSRLPHATLADLLRKAPGFALVDFDGLGFDPQVMVRGFYGGGEAEYVVVLVDGRPVNQLQSGLVAWDVLPPLGSVESIEVVRGGASSLYGDAAIGGVINVITRGASPSTSRLRWEASGGSFGTLFAGADLAGPAAWHRFTLSGGVDRTGGFRDHAERTAIRGQAGVVLAENALGRLALRLSSHWRAFDEPGPLLESLYAANRSGSDPLFKDDHTTDRRYEAGLDAERRLGTHTRLTGAVSGELRRASAIRTLALAPGFGDTKERHADNNRLALSGQLEITDSPLPGADRLVVGIEGNHGGLDSKYYRFDGGELDTWARSARLTGALYAEYTVQATEAVRLSLGGRFDHLRDSFDPRFPGGQFSAKANHSALSPKLGISLGHHHGGGSSGNFYATLSRSFKAPTLDQLYDQRNIPVPFPPFEIRTSNPGLRPQYGTSLEVGAYHSLALVPSLHGTATLSVYQMDMKDELDFDVQSFRYLNIGKSRHRGVEAGANLEGSRASAFASYALQQATSRSGANEGKQLKAIPRHSLTAGGTLLPLRRTELLALSLTVFHVSGMYFDDANSRTLPSYTRLDGQLAVRIAGMNFHLDARNLLGARYSSSGFLDPAGTGEAYLYPAARRVIEVGLRSGF